MLLKPQSNLMIRSRHYLQVDPTGKEIIESTFSFIDMVCNDSDIHASISGCIDPHWHAEMEIFLLLSGRVKINVHDQVYTLYPGEGCFINSNIFHSFTADSPEPCLFRSFVFDSGIVGGTPGSVYDSLYVRPLTENGPAFIRFSDNQKDADFFDNFNDLYNVCRDEPPAFEFKVREDLSKIVVFCRNRHMNDNVQVISHLQEDRIKKMIFWIDSHLEQEISASDIASSANICTRECQRIFKQYLHYRPMEYVRRRRIIATTDKLIYTDIPITEISLMYGFSSPSHFSKEFRTIVGSTPAEYRKLHKPENTQAKGTV